MMAHLEAAGLSPTAVEQLASSLSTLRELEDTVRQQAQARGEAAKADVTGMAMGLTSRILTVLQLLFKVSMCYSLLR